MAQRAWQGEKFLLQRVQIEGVRCDTMLAESAEIHDTCIRPRGCVCESLSYVWSHVHTSISSAAAAVSQSSSQRVGALSLIPSCLGISGHPSGSRQGHPRYTGARSAGRPWVARTQFSTAVQCRNTANMVAELCRSRARALAARALVTRVCCVMADPERSVLLGCLFEQ